MSEENEVQKKSTSRKFILVCWFMVLATLVILGHFTCMIFNKSYPLTEILGVLGLVVTTIITYVTGNVYQKSHVSKMLPTDLTEDEEKAPV